MASIEMKIARRVLISGAAGGIGGTLAQKLVAAGSSVIGTDRRAPADDWSGQPWLIADVGTPAGREVIANGISDDIDGLIFAAGMLDPDGWESITEDEAASLLAVNLTAPLFLTRLLLPRLKPGASIVIIGSIAGMRGSPATPLYAASKAGLRNLAASLSLLLQPLGIRVNVVAPGLIDTPLTAALNADLAERRGVAVDMIEAERAAVIPMGRAGTSEEVADSCLYLLSDRSSYLTGSTMFATGGVLAGMI